VVSFLRLGEQMTQEQAAAHLGVCLTTLRRWQKPEAGIHNITAKELDTKRRHAQVLNEKISRGEVVMGKMWRSR
jgi:DNA-binding transcriptional regulator YiaG